MCNMKISNLIRFGFPPPRGSRWGAFLIRFGFPPPRGSRWGAFLITALIVATQLSAQTPAPCGPVPNENQLRWQDMEMYAFIHYSMNTYTDEEWGFGNEDLKLFNPSDLDCRQWARVCKQAGMKGIIFTAKHHCGFCMWPSVSACGRVPIRSTP